MSKPYVTEEAFENMPKKPQNGFMMFRADNYDQLKSKNSEKTMTEITKMIGELWSDLDTKRKNEYKKKYENEKNDYESHYQSWLKKYKLEEEKVKKFLKDNKPKRRNRSTKQQDDEEQEEKQTQKQEKKVKEEKDKTTKQEMEKQTQKPKQKGKGAKKM